MKLLITTQAVDTEDQILKFFVRWIEEFAKHCEKVTVVCLRAGKYSLPDNVTVIPLGGASRVVRTVRLWRVCISHRKEYDCVFVHMNPEYLIAAGFIWRILQKCIALWYTHKSVNLKLRIAVAFSNIIFTASKESFRLKSRKVRVMGHGIDTDFFSPNKNVERGIAVLSAGRLSPTKRNDLIIEAAKYFPNDVWIAGDGPEMQNLKKLSESLKLSQKVRFLGSQTHEQMRDLYRTAGVFVHTSETGSLDKVVLEALACGLPVVTTSDALSDLPVTKVSATSEDVAEGVTSVHKTDESAIATFVRDHHSLQRLISMIMKLLA